MSKPQFSSVRSLSRLRLCNPMDCSIPGLPVHHQLPKFTQTHVHWVGDAIQPSHPLPSPSPPALNLSQHQGLFHWISSSHQVAKLLVSASAWVVPMNTQEGSPLGSTDWISLQSKGPQEASPTPQFKSISSSALNILYGSTLTSIHDYWKNHSLNYMYLCPSSKVMSLFLIYCLGWS